MKSTKENFLNCLKFAFLHEMYLEQYCSETTDKTHGQMVNIPMYTTRHTSLLTNQSSLEDQWMHNTTETHKQLIQGGPFNTSP